MKKSILLKPAFLASFFSIILSSICYTHEARAESTVSKEARYSLFVIERPSTMPVGIIGFNLNTGFAKLKDISFNMNAEFGITKRIQGSVSWDGFSIDTKAQKNKKFNLNHTANLGLKYNYLNIPHISAAFTLGAPLHIADSKKEVLQSVTLGIPVTFYNSEMAGGILGDLITINFRPDVAVKMDFNWWYGVQAYDKLWLQVVSSFGTVALSNENNVGRFESTAFWKKLPVTLGAIYAFNHYFDIGADVGFGDILKAEDTFKFGLTFTARAGKLFG